MTATCFRPAALAGALALCAAPGAPADAAIQDRQLWFPASGVCDVEDPTLDNSVRRRAGELRNVSDLRVNVTCGLITDDAPVLGAMGQVALYTTNNRAVSVSMACTITAGTSQENQVINKKTITMAAGAHGMFWWNSTHYGTSRQHASISCSLPNGLSIRALSVYYTEEVGA